MQWFSLSRLPIVNTMSQRVAGSHADISGADLHVAIDQRSTAYAGQARGVLAASSQARTRLQADRNGQFGLELPHRRGIRNNFSSVGRFLPGDGNRVPTGFVSVSDGRRN